MQIRLAGPVDRFMRNLKPGHIVSRLNWSLLDDPALFQPGGKWRLQAQHRYHARRMPAAAYFCGWSGRLCGAYLSTQAVLFGIRVHVYPLDHVIDRPDRAAALVSAIRALPEEIQHYKSLLPFKQALLEWLADPVRAAGERISS